MCTSRNFSAILLVAGVKESLRKELLGFGWSLKSQRLFSLRFPHLRQDLMAPASPHTINCQLRQERSSKTLHHSANAACFRSTLTEISVSRPIVTVT